MILKNKLFIPPIYHKLIMKKNDLKPLNHKISENYYLPKEKA